MEKQSGIVLKSYLPEKSKIVLLDQNGSKYHYVPMIRDLCAGTLIQYHVTKNQPLAFIHGIEKIALPLALARTDLVFFHHVLELCYYFVPMESHMPEVYILLTYLYQPAAVTMPTRAKKLLLVKLFIILGAIPEEPAIMKPSALAALGAQPFDRVAPELLELEEARLDAWLRICTAMHPYSQYFKTTAFLDLIGIAP